MAERQPNVVVIFMDDLGYGDTGRTGSSLIKTPVIDGIAEQGMVFHQMYSAPTCTPSRASLLTGRYPQRVGLPAVVFPEDPAGLAPWERTVAEMVRDQGYRTTAIGKWHLGSRPAHHPSRHGFEEFFGILYSNDMAPTRLYDGETVIEEDADQATLTRRYTDRAIDFIRRHQDEPFFVYLAHTMPHIPLAVEEDCRGISEAGTYGDVVECADFHTGRLLDALDELGLSEDTMVVFTSDNGPWFDGSTNGLRGRKAEVFEGGIRVPFFVRWPAGITAGTESAEPALLLDLTPTIAALAGAALPDDRPIDGVDLSGVFAGQPMPPREALYLYHIWSLNAVRSGRWKLHLSRWPDEESRGLPQLFDIDRDPGENYNLASLYPDVVDRLRDLATRFDEEIKGQRPQAEHRARNAL